MRKHTRRGISLAELLTVMAILTSVMSLHSRILIRLLREVRVAQQSPTIQRTLGLLELQLRSDCPMAMQVAISPPTDTVPNTLSLTRSDGITTDYLVRSGQVIRTVRKGTEVLQREEYELPETMQIDVTIDSPQKRVTVDFIQLRRRHSGATYAAPTRVDDDSTTRIAWARVESTWGTMASFVGGSDAK